MDEDKISIIYFRAEPLLRPGEKPSVKDYPLIIMQPGTDFTALVNIPIGPKDVSVIVGMTSYCEFVNLDARFSFSYPNKLGELSIDDDYHRHLPPKRVQKHRINQVRINKPRLRDGIGANRFHIWLCKPKDAHYVYDFGTYDEPKCIPVLGRYYFLSRHVSSATQHYMDELNFKYKGGRDFKKEIQQLAKLTCLVDYSSEDWMIKQRKSKRQLKMQNLQTEHEVERMEYVALKVNEYLLTTDRQKILNIIDRLNITATLQWSVTNWRDVLNQPLIDTIRRIVSFGWSLEAGRQIGENAPNVYIPMVPTSYLGWAVYTFFAVLNLLQMARLVIELHRDNFALNRGADNDNRNNGVSPEDESTEDEERETDLFE